MLRPRVEVMWMVMKVKGFFWLVLAGVGGGFDGTCWRRRGLKNVQCFINEQTRIYFASLWPFEARTML